MLLFTTVALIPMCSFLSPGLARAKLCRQITSHTWMSWAPSRGPRLTYHGSSSLIPSWPWRCTLVLVAHTSFDWWDQESGMGPEMPSWPNGKGQESQPEQELSVNLRDPNPFTICLKHFYSQCFFWLFYLHFINGKVLWVSEFSLEVQLQICIYTY